MSNVSCLACLWLVNLQGSVGVSLAIHSVKLLLVNITICHTQTMGNLILLCSVLVKNMGFF